MNDIYKQQLEEFIERFENFRLSTEMLNQLAEEANKKLIPLERNQAQKAIRLITLLDQAMTKYTFAEKQIPLLQGEIRDLFRIFIDYTSLDEKTIEIYDKYHEESYDEQVEKLENEMLESVNKRFEEDKIPAIPLDEFPVLQGLSIEDDRAWSRELSKVIDSKDQTNGENDFFNNIFQLSEEDARIKFDHFNSLQLQSLLRYYRGDENSAGSQIVEDIRKIVDDKLTFDNFNANTQESYMLLIDLLTRIGMNGTQLNAEEELEVMNHCRNLTVSVDHEMMVVQASPRYDRIISYTLEGEDKESPIDVYHKRIDLVTENIKLLDYAAKQLKSKDAIVRFFAANDEKE